MPSSPSLFRPLRALAPALLILLAACARPAPEAAAPAARADAPAASAPAATPPGTPAADAKPADAPAGKGGTVAGLVAGTDYAEIANGQPFDAAPGKIEVAEVFGYTCPHCAHFEPMLEAWAARQPADVRLVPVAAPFGAYWNPYARAYFAAQAMGVQAKSHAAVFKAIHQTHELPVQPMPTDAQLGAFYARFGADPKQFASTLASFPVQAQVQKAIAFIDRSGVTATPTLVVDGRYRVLGSSFEDQLRVADALVAHVRSHRAAP